MTGQWVTNSQMPKPFPPRFEPIRMAALAHWGQTPITQDEILQWICAGCPDAAGSLLNVTTRQPPVAGQGQDDPGAFMTRLFRCGVFLPEPAECD